MIRYTILFAVLLTFNQAFAGNLFCTYIQPDGEITKTKVSYSSAVAGEQTPVPVGPNIFAYTHSCGGLNCMLVFTDFSGEVLKEHRINKANDKDFTSEEGYKVVCEDSQRAEIGDVVDEVGDVAKDVGRELEGVGKSIEKEAKKVFKRLKF